MGTVQAIEVEGSGAWAQSRAYAAKVEGILDGEMSRKRHSDVEDFLRRAARVGAPDVRGASGDAGGAGARRRVRGRRRGRARSARDSERHVETLLGRVPVPRLAYQAPGVEDLHPMDAALNLPREMYSHGVRRLVAKEAARASFDEVVEMVRDYTGTDDRQETGGRAGGSRGAGLRRVLRAEGGVARP